MRPSEDCPNGTAYHTSLPTCSVTSTVPCCCLWLNTFQQRCLIRILKITYQDQETSEEVHRQTSARPLVQTVVAHRMRFAGHVLQQSPTRLSRMPRTHNKVNGSKDAPRSHGEGHSLKTPKTSTFPGMKPEPPQPIKRNGDRPIHQTTQEDLSLRLMIH